MTTNKNTFVSALLLLIALLIAYRLMPPSVDAIFTMTVSKNKESITHLYQARNIELHKSVRVDKINFTENNRFRHEKLGDLGYADDFFADIDGSFYVKVAADYIFYIASDDGFSLTIDGKKICDRVGDRPLATDVCSAHFDSGLHRLAVSYFQGFGNAGLSIQYANANDGKQYFMGENSKFIKFD